MNSTKSKILVIDDEARMVQVMRLLLEQEGYQVVSAFSGKEGLRVAYEEHPDLVLLDIMMPGMDGFQVLDALRIVTDIPVILLTGAVQDTNQIRGLDKGAADFLAKNTAPDVILAHIRSRLRPAAKWKAPKVRYFDETLAVDLSRRELRLNDQPVHLTPLEWRILQCLIEHEGNVVKYDDLLTAAWDTPEWHDARSIKVRIANLREKLNDRAHPSRYIHNVREEGYLFEVR